MKFVIQKVSEGCVRVNEEIVGKIGKGLVVLVGFTTNDNAKDIPQAIKKILNLRVFENEKGEHWKTSVSDNDYELLIVSQFTLYSVLKGNKPDFHKALEPTKAQELYDLFVETAMNKYKKERIQTGIFGAKMQVSLVNEGPVTIQWEYPAVNEKNIDNSDVEKDNFSKLI